RHPADDESATPADAARALWDALRRAGPDGAPVPELMAACGMRRSWVYNRLREHARTGRAQQVARGRWRAVLRPLSAAFDGLRRARAAVMHRSGMQGRT